MTLDPTRRGDAGSRERQKDQGDLREDDMKRGWLLFTSKPFLKIEFKSNPGKPCQGRHPATFKDEREAQA